MTTDKVEPLQLGDVSVAPGERRRVEIPIARLPTETWVGLPIEVVHGQRGGPRLWLSAAIHGDEMNGVEIIRHVLQRITPADLVGTVIAVPIVNVFGFIQKERYLPDRRDLNRSFPGSASGSLASRLAHLFMKEVVRRCTHGIDLHTGSNYRTNLPQIRANLQDDDTRRLAKTFAAPLMIHSQIRDGSLRQAATKLGIPTLLFEAGEPLRFDHEAIDTGVAGVLRVMKLLGMGVQAPKKKGVENVEIGSTSWVRARHSGILRLDVQLGQAVVKNEVLGVVGNAFGDRRGDVKAHREGVIIGVSTSPLVNKGEAVVHIGMPAQTP